MDIALEFNERIAPALGVSYGGKPNAVEADRVGQAERSPQKSPHGLQNGNNRSHKERAEAMKGNTPTAETAENDCSESPTNTQHFDVEYPQKSPQSVNSKNHRGVGKRRKSKNLIGSSGRTRTYNPSVNRRSSRLGEPLQSMT